jgi:hypothetical protein
VASIRCVQATVASTLGEVGDPIVELLVGWGAPDRCASSATAS